MKKPALFGAGGHAREVISMTKLNFDIFVDDEYANETYMPISSFDPERWRIMICVGESSKRSEIVSRMPAETEYFSYIHPTAIIGENVRIGEGSYIGPGCILTCDITIGKHALINRGNHIGHDSNIGDFFSMMPGSVLSGSTSVGNRVYIGTNSSTREGSNVCDDVTIGMMSGVIGKIESPGTYLGCPARKIKEKTPKVSVIIPCSNFEKYIKDCIDGALMQEADFDFEVIVGDDCSTDSSYEIIKSYGTRIKHYRNDSNLGAYGNIRRLIEMSRGEYIAYVDGDDFFEDPKKLQKQADFLDANPEYSMHSTGCQHIFEDGTYSELTLVPLREILTSEDIADANLVSFGRMFRNQGEPIGEWMRESPFLDWCMNFEISLGGKVKCEEWSSGRYRLGAGGMISRLSDLEVAQKNAECRDMIRKRRNNI